MAVQFTLGALSAVNKEGNHYIVDFLVGNDSEGGLQIFMSVGLLSDDTDLSTLELVFGIRLVEFETVSDFLVDHRTARKFVPKEVAAEVTSLIHTAVRRLVAAASPRRIVMETFEAKLPPNAMGKYMRIISVLGTLGYTLEVYFRSPEDQKDYWVFDLDLIDYGHPSAYVGSAEDQR